MCFEKELMAPLFSHSEDFVQLNPYLCFWLINALSDEPSILKTAGSIENYDFKD